MTQATSALESRASLVRTAAVSFVLVITVLAACSSGEPREVVSVSLDNGPHRILQGSTLTLAPIVVVSGGASPLVTWQSSAPDVASAVGGLIEGRRLGSASITATSAEDPSKSATVTVEVVAIPAVVSVTISPEAPAALRTGEEVQLTATAAATGGASEAVAWSSANSTIASVSESGLVRGLSVGSTSITATSIEDASKSASVAITVLPVPAVVSVAISPATPDALPIGENVQLDATVTVIGGASEAVTWSSADEAVANVSETGLVSGLSVGSTSVTATSVEDTSRSASVVIEVVEPPIVEPGPYWEMLVTSGANEEFEVTGASVAFAGSNVVELGASSPGGWSVRFTISGDLPTGLPNFADNGDLLNATVGAPEGADCVVTPTSTYAGLTFVTLGQPEGDVPVGLGNITVDGGCGTFVDVTGFRIGFGVQ